MARITELKNQPLSDYITRGTLILALCLLGIVLLANVFERFLLTLLHPETWNELEKPGAERRRRSFTYFHVGVCIQIGLICIGTYPAFDFLIGRSDLSAPYISLNGRRFMSIGDILFVVCQIHNAYYIFELCFRTRFASPINIAHHIGLVCITQTSIALFGSQHSQGEGVLDLYMCIVWGVFDLVVELPIYASMIIWRVKADNHKLLYRLLYFCATWAVLGAVAETVVTIYLMKASWDLWSLHWKIIIPAIFSLWIITQFWGAYRIRQMAQGQAVKLADLHPELRMTKRTPNRGPFLPRFEIGTSRVR
ncbi:hypothetical protein ACHAQH_009308 [Verticillium albo-atrum]